MSEPQYFVRVDTYWQNSPDRFVGPFGSREAAQKAIDAAIAAQMSTDVKNGVRVFGILTATESAKLHRDSDNTISRMPLDASDLSRMIEYMYG